MIKKADIFLTLALIIAGLAISYFLTVDSSSGSVLKITSDGKLFGSYSLLEDQQISLDKTGHHNTVEISDGTVSMVSSDCSGQDCVHQRSISESGESIVCLPNRIVLEISGGKAKYDSIAR